MISETYSTRKDSWKRFLGRTTREITQSLGKPFASYTFRDQEIYLYDSNPVSSIALQNGIVITCNEAKDARTALRVRPRQKIATLFNSDSNKRGMLDDISVQSASIHIDEHRHSDLNSVSSVSFSLTVDGVSRFLEVPCALQQTRTDAGKTYAIFLFDFTGNHWKKRIISRFISINTAESALYSEYFPF